MWESNVIFSEKLGQNLTKPNVGDVVSFTTQGSHGDIKRHLRLSTPLIPRLTRHQTIFANDGRTNTYLVFGYMVFDHGSPFGHDWQQRPRRASLDTIPVPGALVYSPHDKRVHHWQGEGESPQVFSASVLALLPPLLSLDERLALLSQPLTVFSGSTNDHGQQKREYNHLIVAIRSLPFTHTSDPMADLAVVWNINLGSFAIMHDRTVSSKPTVGCAPDFPRIGSLMIDYGCTSVFNCVSSWELVDHLLDAWGIPSVREE